ncbi:MAG: acyl-CoA hydrolase/GNAT superfamily N-acetyltransferase [bacterium]|jgi:acyl-CoA hydrolase/GNAT superfamily N-acetyltransferase
MANKEWTSKKVSIETAISKIQHGSHIYISNGAATPNLMLTNMVRPEFALVDNEIIQFLPIGPTPHLEDGVRSFRTNSFFIDGKLYQASKRGYCDYTPVDISAISKLIEDEQIRIDIAIIKITPPNEEGFCSLGIAVDCVREMIEKAKIVIAEVNPQMPWTYGNSLVSNDQIDYWIDNDEELATFSEEQQSFLPTILDKDVVLSKIGNYIANEIPDNATIQIGLGEAPNSVIPFLDKHQNLGLHTELLTDGLMHLIKSGVINNSQKTFLNGRSIVSHAFGSKDLYKFVDSNPEIEFHPFSFLSNWNNIGKNDNMIAIAEGYEVDLTGQICAESKGYDFYGGFGGKSDFCRGSLLSKGGKSIIAMPSTSNNGRESNIVLSLSVGSGVVITRAEVHYVVTEYGVAYLFGKTIRERALALIEIAHPKFRERLFRMAKQHNYVNPKQPGAALRNRYPKEAESIFSSKNHGDVIVRPVRPIDESKVRDFFHSLSDRSVYLRYFQQIRSLPHQVLQKTVDIDYSYNFALIVLDSNKESQKIIGMGQWVVDEHVGIPDLAFQVRDDWQGEGVGWCLFNRLVEVAQSRKITTLKADVLAENKPMLALFERCGYPIQKKHEFGVVNITFDISQKE